MHPARLPNNENERLELLNALNILDTPPSERLDRVTRLAAEFFNVPIALVTLIDADRQWFKSRFGLLVTETPREISLCSHAILEKTIFIVPDCRKDPRFCDLPKVNDSTEIVFYAGCPFYSQQGVALGTLCVADSMPRTFDDNDIHNLRDFTQLVQQYFHSLEEVTYTKTVEDNLATAEVVFSQTFNQAAVGMANLSLEGKWTRVNPKLCEMLGYTEQELLKKDFQEITHPDDLNTDLQLLVQLISGEIDTFSIEKRYFDIQHKVIWILLTVSIVKTPDGQPSHFIAIIIDINEKIAAENQLKQMTDKLEIRVKERTEQLERMLQLVNDEVEQRIETQALLNIEKERLKEITDNVPALVSCVNHDLRYTFSNRTYEDWFGISSKKMHGMYIPEVIGEASFNHARKYIEQVMAGFKVAFENTIPTLEGIKHVQTTLIPNRDKSINEFYILSLDISELKKLQETLVFEASHDMLTGLPNRRAFMDRLNHMLHNKPENRWVTLFFLDLDGFKALNDNYGHGFGDRVLKAVAEVIRDSVEPGDFTARLAGDEFTILFSRQENPKDEAIAICQGLIDALASIHQLYNIPVRLSSSIGIHIEKNSGELSAEHLLTNADQAMYLSKLNNKGTFTINAIQE
ncbi:diguanylate cyclase domain-containing protein [Budvicia diplopodorum]|uniref:diguanylate cyclase domain-containing protein n=1 Tax=Budvicia diplopodorum TaxID=1119056 RepID=UPI00135C1F5F|nr:diguanylate cyclase [Budvicia diplopodorum]